MALHLTLKRLCVEALYKSHAKNFLSNFKPILNIDLQRKLYSSDNNFRKGNIKYLNIINYEAIYQSWGLNAIEDCNGNHSYSQLFTKSLFLKSNLEAMFGSGVQRNVATLLSSDASYVIAQWAIWGSFNVAVPLLPTYPMQQLEYLLQNSKASVVITTKEYFQKFSSILSGLEAIVLEDHFVHPSLLSEGEQKEEALSKEFCKEQINSIKQDSALSNALIIYTSGTTGPPKGVVLNHKNLLVNVNSILNAWKITQQDVSLQCLPLNHIHGIVYALTSPLLCGARVIMEPKFDASKVWSRLINSSETSESQVSVFMAVPTMYVKLIEEYERNFSKDKNMVDVIKNHCQKNIRLMVSGSASLPTPILEKWKEITGHTLVERYGMTEIGLALSNPLEGERKPGFVGKPLDNVAVRICEFSPERKSYEILVDGNANSTSVADGYNGAPGELLIKGDNVFSHYWEKEEETRKNFTEDGWFITGDTAAYIDGNYKIVGRTSVDLIKSGGFKISALDIERCLMVHPDIVEVAVVGIPDSTWGEKVAALIVWKGSTPFILQELRTWAKGVMPRHQIPSEVKLLDELPRNQLGKVNKKQLIRDHFTLAS